MKIAAIFICALALSGSAHGQLKTGQTTSRGPVTLAELADHAIEMKFVRDQVAKREGGEYPVRIEVDLKVVLGPGDRINWILGNTIHTPNGAQKPKPTSFSSKLEKPEQTRFFGAGHGVWIFSEGILTTLRTYPTGAFKREIKFARAAKGLECTATEGLAREDGAGGVVMTAPDGRPVTIVSEKLVSSSCRVTRAK
jgi:hypothetical protein